jgi:hypothetical protein
MVKELRGGGATRIARQGDRDRQTRRQGSRDEATGIARRGDEHHAAGGRSWQRRTTCIAMLVACDRGIRRHRSRWLSPWIANPGDKASGARRHVTHAWATCLARGSDMHRGERRQGSPSMSLVLATGGDNDHEERRHGPRGETTWTMEHVVLRGVLRRQRSRRSSPRYTKGGDMVRGLWRRLMRDGPISSATKPSRFPHQWQSHLRSRRPRAPQPFAGAEGRGADVAVRGEQGRRGVAEAAASDHTVGRCSETSAIGARIDVCGVPVQVPHRNFTDEIELAPDSGSLRRGPHRRDGRYARATHRIQHAARVVAPVDRVLVGGPWICRPPRELPLLASSRRRVFRLRLAWQEAPVPDAERIRFPPIHAIDRQSLVVARQSRPRRGAGVTGEVDVRRRDVGVVRCDPARLVGPGASRRREPLSPVQVRMLSRPRRRCVARSAIPRIHELTESTHCHKVLVQPEAADSRRIGLSCRSAA